MTDNDMQPSAERLIEQHGRQAVVVAADKFIACKKAGDDNGMEIWVEVLLALRELSSKSADQGPARANI